MNHIDYRSGKYNISRVIERLAEFLTESRRQKIDTVLASRSNYFVPVLEGLYDRGNVSAVMRSAEAMGFYKLHIIEKFDDFKDSQKRVSQGADKWLDIQKWKSTLNCIHELKKEGYQVFTTALSEDAVSFEDLDFSKKTAVIFGNEKSGVSEEALKLSDGNVLLPMSGFTQSFNISVAAALSLQSAALKKPKVIDEDEKTRLKALYYLKTLDWPKSALFKVLQEEESRS